MSFSNKIKTILELDDKDWKRALGSISEAEKEYYKESKRNTEQLIQAKEKLQALEEENSKKIKNINDQIIQAESEKTKAMKSGNSEKIKQYNESIRLLKQELKETKLNSSSITADTKKEINQLNQKISSQKQYNSILKEAKARHSEHTDAINKQEKATSNIANTTIRYLRWMGTLVGAYYAVSRGMSYTVGRGIEVSRMMEDNKNGIAALLSANTQMVLSNGQVVNSYEKFKIGQTIGTQALQDLKKASVDTYATFPQLTEIFQQATGQTLSMGDAFGETVDEITANTIKLAQRMSNIGGAIGMPMDRIKEEIRSLLSGNASTDSLISTMLFGSPTKANEAIREAKTRGKNGMKDMLDSILKPFDVLEGVDTYTRSLLNLQDAWDTAMQSMVEKSGLFTDLKNAFNSLSKDLKTNTDSIISSFDSIYNNAKTVGSIIETIAVPGSVIASIYALKVAVEALTGAAMRNPLIAAFTAVGVLGYGAFKYFDDLNEKAKELTETINLSEKELTKLTQSETKAQQKLIEDNIAAQYDKLEELKKQASNPSTPGFFVTEERAKIGNRLVQESLEKEQKVYDTMLSQYGVLVKLNEERDTQGKKLKEQAELLTEIPLDQEIAKKVKEDVEKSKGEIYGLRKEIKALDEQMSQLGKMYVAAPTEELKAQVYAQIQNYTEAIRVKEKEISDIQSENSEKELSKTESLMRKREEINKKTSEHQAILERIRQIESGSADEEQQKISLLNIELSGLLTKYKLLDDGFEKDKTRLDIREKELEITKQIETAEEKRYRTIEKQAEKIKSVVRDYEKASKTIIKNTDANDDDVITPKEYEAARKKITDQYLLAETKITQARITAESDLNKENIKSLSEVFNKHAEDIATVLGNRKFQAEKINIDEVYNGSSVLSGFDAEMENLKEKAKEIFSDLNEEFRSKSFVIDVKLEGYDEVSNNISQLMNSFGEMTNSIAEVAAQQAILNATRQDSNSTIEDIAKEEKKLYKLQQKQTASQIGSYGDMAGAIKGFVKEGSKEYKTLQKVQQTMYMAEFAMNAARMVQQVASTGVFVASKTAEAQASGIAAVANQGSGDPYTAFGRMAAMAAIVASLGLLVGGFGGKSKETVSYDYYAAMARNEGKGSVLGDADAVSESINNSLSILEDFAKPQFQVLQSMNKYLKNISDNIVGLTSILFRNEEFALGKGFTGINQTTQNVKLSDSFIKGMDFLTNPAGKFLDKILPLGSGNGIIGGLVNKVLGGLFGKTSVSQIMTDSGIYFADQLLGNAIESFSGAAYQTVLTMISTKSWFKKSSSAFYSTYFESLDSETNRQFSLVLKNIYGTVLTASDALDENSKEFKDKLNNFVVSIGSVSLMNKSGSQVQELLSNVFGKVGDDIAKYAFPLLASFQKVGEGMFETMTRVATGMEEAEYYIERLGKGFEDLKYTELINKQGNVGFEALLQSIVKADEATYGLNNNLVQIIGNLDSTAEELYGAYIALDRMRDTLKFLKLDTDAISYSSIRGAGSVEALADGMNAYIENFLTDEEQLAYKTMLLRKEFSKLDIAMPSNKEGFTALINSLDLSTDAGQELYGRLIILSEGFATVADETDKLMSSIKDSFLKTIQTIEDAINALLGNVTGTDSVDKKIEQYWLKREKVDALLAKGDKITKEEVTTLDKLVSEVTSLATGIQSEYKYGNALITKDLVGDLSGVNNVIINVNEQIQSQGINRGFSSGGYTGDGGKYQAAGIVHKGEYVINSEELRALGGEREIRDMIRKGIFEKNVRTSNNSNYYGQTNKNIDIIKVINGLEQRLEQIEKNTKKSSTILDEAQYGQRPLSVRGVS